MRAWAWWERFASAVWRAPPIPGSPHGLLRLRFERYDGPTIVLADGTAIASGSRIGEIHLNNRVLSVITADSPWAILPAFTDELRALAAWSQRADFPADVAAVHALTLLSKGAPRLGFTVRPRRMTVGLRLQRIYLAGLLQIYSSGGAMRAARGNTRHEYPSDVWLSRRTLLQIYGVQATG